ncbi:MAG: NYN domain-containing protein [Myxococcales bacterium]|nr:NYN domain-containing protein [Myxococcales bacterium]
MKAGIFVDCENLNRCGGWNLRYDVLRRFVEAQGATVLRANAYLAQDVEREEHDPEYRSKKRRYRHQLRSFGFKLVTKPVQRFYDEDGNERTKANADLELAVDALLQGRGLEYVVIASGDGDFSRLVRALQDHGCRVDVLGFDFVSRELRESADHFHLGYLLPDLVPVPEGRECGYLVRCNADRTYGFIRHLTSLEGHDEELFFHRSEVVDGESPDQLFDMLSRPHAIEYTRGSDERGRPIARRVSLTSPRR